MSEDKNDIKPENEKEKKSLLDKLTEPKPPKEGDEKGEVKEKEKKSLLDKLKEPKEKQAAEPKEKPPKEKSGLQAVANNEIIEEISRDKKSVEKGGFISHLFQRFRKGELKSLNIVEEYKGYKEHKHETLRKYMAYETVVQGATDDLEYYVLLILSCLIATFGLYNNSPATIIGAMIVAPLMGPILGFSAGMLWGSWKVIWEAVTTLFKGIALVLFITSLMTYLIPFIEITSEMAARSHPSLADIVIALACGSIGAYAYVNNKVSSAIPGVAISVALMPPLCTIGIGLGLVLKQLLAGLPLDWQLTQGAILLFLVNLVGISLAASVVFYLVKLHPQAKDQDEFAKAEKRAFMQVAVSIVVLLLICVPLILFMVGAYLENQNKSSLYNTVTAYYSEDNIYSLDIDNRREEGYRIKLILFSDEEAGRIKSSPEQISEVMSDMIGRPVEFRVYSISRTESGR